MKSYKFFRFTKALVKIEKNTNTRVNEKRDIDKTLTFYNMMFYNAL